MTMVMELQSSFGSWSYYFALLAFERVQVENKRLICSHLALNEKMLSSHGVICDGLSDFMISMKRMTFVSAKVLDDCVKDEDLKLNCLKNFHVCRHILCTYFK